jgi:hypothetical protein
MSPVGTIVLVLVVPPSLGSAAYNIQTKSYGGQAVLVLDRRRA